MARPVACDQPGPFCFPECRGEEVPRCVSQDSMTQILIVGGGISGLASAFRLQQALPAADITVLERRDRPGGTIWTERRDGYQVEIGPNGFLDNKPTTLALCRDLGLESALIPASDAAGKNRFLFWDNKLHLLPGGLRSFLSSHLLTWRGKLGFIAEPFRRPPGQSGDESIAAFARRRVGAEAARVFADALVTGIYAGDPELLSIRACFPRIAALEREYGSVIKGLARSARRRRAEAAARGESMAKNRMWTLRQGMRALIEALCDRLQRPPVRGVNVRRLAHSEGQGTDRPAWVVHGEGHDSWPADVVVTACPAYQQAAILHDLDPELADRINAIAYNRVAVVALGYRRQDVPGSLDGFGFITPQGLRRDLLGVQWCSSIFPERAPGGMVLLRAMCGGWQRPDIAGYPEDRLLEAVQSELRLVMHVKAAPVFHHIVRWDRAIPQYQVGHLERVEWIEERARRYPGLFLTGNAYRGVALNDCTEQAEGVADRVREYVKRFSSL